MSDKTPLIVVLSCNWCTYAGADLAGVSRFQMPTNFRLIRTMCSARIDPELVLRAFAKGADGVIVAGCHPGDCHYISGNYRERRRIKLLERMLKQIGISPKRFRLEWISASEGQKFADTMTQFSKQIDELGLSPIRKKLIAKNEVKEVAHV
ncbi:MAG TPA: hydrogenase iron-sulfur subunit [Caldisericia bacterium]|nr:hydrogenase iron-sulfur subunit [Caldisericia bacterium]HPF49359.1 hydrogenase iron-sulfur subunit [Caldisericia bacterium]HPI84435.1 hydrogenase iron-sulfur subunit [Caldisericia bacterium]HPQ93804.1 hydrogenase iron-sulfur subunit [Caldisericia bacterium]HRV75632.1 hydrogenase iron-sulfur subunit [Caldisericia bacterium]